MGIPSTAEAHETQGSDFTHLRPHPPGVPVNWEDPGLGESVGAGWGLCQPARGCPRIAGILKLPLEWKAVPY